VVFLPDSIRIRLRPVRKKAALRQIKRGKKVTATALVTRSGKKISAPKQRIALRWRMARQPADGL
jgi:hypothetical protein